MCAELMKQMNIKTRIGPTISALMSSLVKSVFYFYFIMLSNTSLCVFLGRNNDNHLFYLKHLSVKVL